MRRPWTGPRRTGHQVRLLHRQGDDANVKGETPSTQRGQGQNRTGILHLPLLNCRFCKYETPLPTEGVSQVVTEHEHGQFRADVAALNRQGKVVAVVEVVNTNPPSEQVLAAQSELAGAFYIELDALDNGFTGYCSPFCWTNRNEENVSHWSVPTCSACERPYHTLEFHTSSWIGRTPTTPCA